MLKHTHSPSISVFLFVSQRHTHMCEWTARAQPLLWPLKSQKPHLSSQSKLVGRSNHLIKNISVDRSVPRSNMLLWYKPITEALIHALFLFLYSPEGIYCSARLFTSKRSLTRCTTSCTPAVVHQQQIPWRYCRVGNVMHVEMSHWARHSAPGTAGRFIELCRAACLVL